jgi:hypothetical protein
LDVYVDHCVATASTSPSLSECMGSLLDGSILLVGADHSLQGAPLENDGLVLVPPVSGPVDKVSPRLSTRVAEVEQDHADPRSQEVVSSDHAPCSLCQ